MRVGNRYKHNWAGIWEVVKLVEPPYRFDVKCIDGLGRYEKNSISPFVFPLGSDWVLIEKKKLLVKDIL